MNLLTRSVLMGVVLVLAISGFRWFPPLMMLVNPFPLLLFFLVSKRERYGFLVLGSIAGLFAFLVSSGPGSFWVLQYVSEAWFISRLVNMLSGRSGVSRYALVWIAVGIDFGVGLLFRKLLEYPLQTPLLKDWLMMEGVTGLLGMLLVLIGHSLGWMDGRPSQKQHGIGIPLT